MDEVLLNDLLECSVCLERLDTSSRVLPCQHTFCLKCLKVIVESHKELRCPECRVLVEGNIDELPPNVLLMRILEGMKNAPRKPTSSNRGQRSGHLQGQGHQPGQPAIRAANKQPPPYARALYNYTSTEPEDLSFKKGEIILLHKKIDPFWYEGEVSGRTGMFPMNYVQVVVPLPVSTALCKALYDFKMSAPDEEGCLAFEKGAIISVHRRVDENWAEGRLDQRVGIFPIAFVDFNQSAMQLINSTPLNRPAPKIPERARASSAEQRQHPHRYQQMSASIPTTVPAIYQNIPAMSQSHPNYHAQPVLATQPQILVPQPVNQQTISAVSHGGLVTTTAIPRTIMEPTQTKHSLDLIHLTSAQNKGTQSSTMGLQSVSRIGDNFDRLRTVKYDSYNTTPIHKAETTYQNVRTHEHFPVTITNFNNVSSDSSSSVNTPSFGVSQTTTPNTSSSTSTCESAEPSVPNSPDNNIDRNQTTLPSPVQNENVETNKRDDSLNTSMGVLTLNESSTATNTSLNVSLPPTESPELNISITNQNNTQESISTELSLEAPSSSKTVLRPSGPDSILNFGLGLQAALSPSHGKDGNYMIQRAHRDHHHREKRHSLTSSSHLQGNHSQNRHSAEIVATSLLDHTPERDRDRPERDRERRRRRSRSNERPLPASYVALYPYKPQKPDELELRKGCIYTVTERCRDGWFKGRSERSQRAGVFPGNYVALHYRQHDKNTGSPSPVSRSGTSPAPSSGAPTAAPAPTAALPHATAPGHTALAPPDAPPRSVSPHTLLPQTTQNYLWNVAELRQATQKSDKPKDKSKSEKSTISTGVSLMKRLAAMKKCKSPPPAGYSMDNPVFEEGPGSSLMLGLQEQHHPVHVRPTNEGPWQSQHRKSQSLDVTAPRRERPYTQTVKERFRCIVPYPPNTEYELELKVDDIVIVSKKRGDGWYKGTLQRTGRTGLFPASFVQSYPLE